MFGNWINQTTTTTGTGALTLATVSGYPPASSQFAQDERFQYAILDDATGAPLERGIGYLNGTGELVREKPLAAMSAGTYSGANVSALSLAAGTKRVICSPAAQAVLGTLPGAWLPSGGTRGYGDAGVVAATSTLALTVDRAYAMPFVAAVDADVDALAINVTTLAAGATGKLAIFSYGLDGLPGVMLAEGSVIDLSTTGEKYSTFTRMRPPPRFFACLLTTGAAATVTSSSNGFPTANAMGFNSSFVPVGFVHHVGATGLAFPAIWTPVENLANSNRPLIAARIV